MKEKDDRKMTEKNWFMPILRLVVSAASFFLLLFFHVSESFEAPPQLAWGIPGLFLGGNIKNLFKAAIK